MTDHRQPHYDSALGGSLRQAPLVAAAILICVVCGFNLFRLMRAQAPRNPWEAIEIVEAWRSLQGMPVYELGSDGHATHMYGALVPIVQGEVFRWVGPNNVTGRGLSLISALLVVTILAVSMNAGRSPWYLAIGWAAILGVNHRSGHYFAENRPDMPALLFATIAIVLFWYGHERRRGLFHVLGSLCLVAGFFVKQPVFVFAVVPCVALVLSWRRPRRSEVIYALLPLAVAAATVVALKAYSPAVYHFMVEVPGGYAINWPRAVKYLWELLLDSPLFLFFLGEWIVFDKVTLKDSRTKWLIAVLAVTIPWSAVSHAKVGGWPNSMLPALLPMMAFCALRLPVLLGRLESLVPPRHSRFACVTFLALLLLMTTFPHLTVANGPLVSVSPWDRDYWKVVEIARSLPGRVVCPEDPSIPLYAKRYVGQNIFSEKDARPCRGEWPTATPEPVLAELGSAEFVIDVTNYWGENVDGRLLDELGFEPVRDIVLDAERYLIWRRKATGSATAGDQTVLLDSPDMTGKGMPAR